MVGVSPLPHPGNPFREQARFATGEAYAVLVGPDGLGVVTVTGPDRLDWLHRMTSQQLGGVLPGESHETLFLDPAGHITHAVNVVDDGVTAWLITARAATGSLAAFLERMRFRLDVAVADVSAAWQIAAARDTAALAEVPPSAPNGVALDWTDPWSTATGHRYSTSDLAPWSLVLRLVPADHTLAPTARPSAVEALRIAAGRPSMAEVDDRSLPHELDWLRSAVSLTKGCYRGQETVAKVVNLGRPPRRLVFLHLDGDDPTLPEPHTPLWSTRANADAASNTEAASRTVGSRTTERREVGIITASAQHYELGPIALALVKRQLPADVPLVVGPATGPQSRAAQTAIVPVEAGPRVTVPRLPRLTLR